MKPKFDISIIIPTFNRSRLLGYSLDSIVKQDFPVSRFEVIVSDDGSSDNTKRVVRSYRKRINIKYVFQEDKGYRPASARNNGIRIAEGNLCLFIDSGMILAPTCISEHFHFHSKLTMPSAAIGYIYGFDFNEDLEDLLITLIDPSDASLSVRRLMSYSAFKDAREQQFVRHGDRIENLPIPWYYFWSGHISLRRESLLTVGLFDENYDGRWGMEDIDLGFRIHREGVRICLLRSAIGVHYPHGRVRVERHNVGLQNCEYFHRKFQTRETQLYLQNYNKDPMVDINEIRLTELSCMNLDARAR